MSGKIRNYYAQGNTAKGFWSFYKSNIKGMERLFLVKGQSGKVKSNLYKTIGAEWVDKGYDIEFLHGVADDDFITGVIIPKLKIGIVDGSQQIAIELSNSGVVEKNFDLDLAFEGAELDEHKNEIFKLETKKRVAIDAAYYSFNEALIIHDEWEKIYIENMNFSKATELTEDLEIILFQDKAIHKKSVVRDRFMGGATPSGPKDFIDNLTSDINKRYFIKGRPGTGKSTLLKKLAENAEKRGFDVEIYHCGFDPNSLDMLIFRELDLAIFDSTSPHEYFPERKNDEIIDMYKEAVNLGTDEKYWVELQDIVQRYKNKIQEGTGFLSKAKTINDELEKIYISFMDFEKVEEIKNEINNSINSALHFQ